VGSANEELRQKQKKAKHQKSKKTLYQRHFEQFCGVPSQQERVAPAAAAHICEKTSATRRRHLGSGTAGPSSPPQSAAGETSGPSSPKRAGKQNDLADLGAKKYFVCTKCRDLGFVVQFKTKYVLLSHLMVHQKDDEKGGTKPCSKCFKKFKTKKKLYDHSRKNHAFVVVTCEKCGIRYSSDRAFKNHLKKCIS
jgi:hypothetical protein